MTEKRCVTCHQLRPLSDFNRRSAAPDGLQQRCRDCCRAWYAEHRVQHKKNVRARNVSVLGTYRDRLGAYLLAHPCVDCGESDVRVLEFDHREDEKKLAEVSVLVARLVAWERIEAEIAKCDVRCANCHRRVTAERAGSWRQMLMILQCAERIAEERRQAS